jgi:hypothetical protein
MAYIGNIPAEKYLSLAVQHFTVTATASYVLTQSVASQNEIALFINNVRQEPGGSYAYTAAGTTLTLSAATAATDTMYCVYLGKAIGTVIPPDGSVNSAKIVDGSITNDDLAGSISSAKITSLDATKLTGTVADARFPATLPASSGANLTALPAANLTGTVADARFPATLPAISGANLTGIVSGADLHQAHQGIASLGLVVAIEHNKVAGNYGNTFLDIFQDDSGITTEITVDRNASEYVSTVVGGTTNATGTLVSDVQTAASSTTEVSGVFLYTDTHGTNTIGTDLKIYFTANNGTNWTEAVSYGTATIFSGSIKQVKCGKTTVTAGTQIAMKAVWANQLAYSAGTSANAGDYTGIYSAGNRSSIIAVTTNVVIQGNVITNLVLGGYQSNSFYFGNDTIGSSEYIRFALSAGQVINEFRWYNDTVVGAFGTWQWQGSNNGSSWTDIGSTFTIDTTTMVGSAPSYLVVTAMSGNTTSYTWYQMKGVSGTVTTASNHGEITFKTGYVAGTSAVTGKVAHLEGWAVNY